jgi:Ser/Thr protein kinase RdoA (MazF antagonist)
LRPAGPHSPTLHSLLRYLEERGFEGAPQVVGSGFDVDGRETLSFLEGDRLDPRVPTEEEAWAIGSRLRELHDVTEGFVAPKDATWQPSFLRQLGNPRLIGHCDLAPWNVLFTPNNTCVFIDWETAGPVDPLIDLAHAAWLNARLFSDDIAEKEGLPSLDVRTQTLRALVDGYALPASERSTLFDRMIEVAVHSIAAEADEFSVTRDTETSRALWGMAWRARSASWMLANRAAIRHALTRSLTT